MKKICVLTGTRAEYGLLRPVMRAVSKHPNLELSIIAAGMHLSGEFGHTLDEIIKDGFEVTKKVEMNPRKDSGLSMAQSVGKGIAGIAHALRRIMPDFFLVLGDRIEPLAGVIAAAYMNIPIAHIHGGDISRAGLDESARHAITKFAHIHLPATKKSAQRILRMGEDDWRIFIVGAPCIDNILNEKLLAQKEIESNFQLPSGIPFILLVQHSVTTEPEQAGRQMRQTLKAIRELKYQTITIYPNSDAGGRRIIKVIKEYQNLPFLRCYKNLPHNEYISLLKYAKVMVGNSSSGIIESASLKLPVVNIGTRQEKRERAENIIDVRYDKNEIVHAIEKALYDKKFRERVQRCNNPYGDGKTGPRVASILADISINTELLQKQITY